MTSKRLLLTDAVMASAIATTLLVVSCTGSEPSRSSEDSKVPDELRDEILRKHLRAGETDLVDDDLVRNPPK
jgi:hypothetical protein